MEKKIRHTNLIEVAREAGVGTTTVSRVINGGQNVDPQTMARVRLAIETLHYTPNQGARILKGGRTRTIGFVIPSITDPFFSCCAEAAYAIARSHESVLIVLTTNNDQDAEINAVNVLMRHRPDGFIIAPANSKSVILRDLLRRIEVPIIALDRPIAGSEIPSVVADNFASTQIATRHLIEHGYRRIVCLTGDAALYTIQERIRGYRKAMRSAGLDYIVNASIRDYASAEYAIKSTLTAAEHPDAFLTLKNSTTIYAFEALQRLKVSVPDRVALLGYDDFELADTVRPSISVMRQPTDEIGRITAELLFERLLNPQVLGPAAGSNHSRQIQVKTSLIRRHSCGCSPSSE